MIKIAEVPCTLTGTNLELPIKKLLLGQALHKVVSRDALANPKSLDWCTECDRRRGEAN